MMTTYYKVLSEDGKSIHGGDWQWGLPQQQSDGTWKPGKWHSVTGELEPCRNGIHVVEEKHLYEWYKWDCTVWEVETTGRHITEGNKTVVRKARLLRPRPHPQWWLDAITFVSSLKDVRWLQPDGEPLPEWQLFTAETWDAARDAAWDAAWDAAKDAAKDAALYNTIVNLCSDLPIDPRYIEHARARWQVWQKGYACLCDVNGVLYVYAATGGES